MIRPCKTGVALALVVLLLAASTAFTQTSTSLFFEDFESYNLGTLDKNDRFTSGPNVAANGSGNPWFGPEIHTPNAVVIGPENGATPHSGNQMIRGWAPSDIDQDWYNLAYRLNHGLPFLENISLDWWFYDPIDPNDPSSNPFDFRDYVALGNYDTTPTDRDGPDNLVTWDLLTGSTISDRFSLGAGPPSIGGIDPTVYQARVPAAGGLGNGWFNLSTMRSLGWHHGMMAIGPLLGDGTNDISFFIDDLTTPVLVQNSVTTHGYNVIEININFGPVTGYYDDINFSVVTP